MNLKDLNSDVANLFKVLTICKLRNTYKHFKLCWNHRISLSGLIKQELPFHFPKAAKAYSLQCIKLGLYLTLLLH